MGTFLVLCHGWSECAPNQDPAQPTSVSKRLKRLKSWDVLSKGIVFKFVSSSMHVSSDSSLPDPLVCAVDTRCEHVFSSVITWNFSQSQRTHLALSDIVTLNSGNPHSAVCPFQFSDPSLPYNTSSIETTLYYYYSYRCNFYLWLHLNMYCSSECNFVNCSACTGDTYFNFYLFSLSWCYPQTLSAILLFLYSFW